MLTFAAMKILALILSFFVFVLSMTPILGALELLPDTVCCEASCEEGFSQAEEHPLEGNCEKNCNPFQSCQCCIGFIQPEDRPALRMSQAFLLRNDFFTPPVSNPVVSPVWHPPQG
jgi:hypothetical protein